MTTFVTFAPSSIAPFQFNPILDNVAYVAICPWNVYGQRYYLTIYTNSGQLVLSIPIVGSPNNYDINLLFGYFRNSTLVYRTSSNTFEINP